MACENRDIHFKASATESVPSIERVSHSSDSQAAPGYHGGDPDVHRLRCSGYPNRQHDRPESSRVAVTAVPPFRLHSQRRMKTAILQLHYRGSRSSGVDLSSLVLSLMRDGLLCASCTILRQNLTVLLQVLANHDAASRRLREDSEKIDT
jgi:hypothetical protein